MKFNTPLSEYSRVTIHQPFPASLPNRDVPDPPVLIGVGLGSVGGSSIGATIKVIAARIKTIAKRSSLINNIFKWRKTVCQNYSQYRGISNSNEFPLFNDFCNRIYFFYNAGEITRLREFNFAQYLEKMFVMQLFKHKDLEFVDNFSSSRCVYLYLLLVLSTLGNFEIHASFSHLFT